MSRVTFSLGLLGYPLSHSLSPVLHRAALQACGLAGDYRLYPLPPTPAGLAEIRSLVQELRAGRLAGLNVTIPHKQAVLALVDCLSPTVQSVGAANTLYLKNGQCWAENTDVDGFLTALHLHFPGLFTPANQASSPTALILGAGGSSRAIAYALATQGWHVCVAARRIAQAHELAAALCDALPGNPDPVVEYLSLDSNALDAWLTRHPVDLLVNATPAGMISVAATNPWPAGLQLPPGAAVYDLVYNPPETALLKMARSQGNPCTNGLGMLIEQAARSFTLWTGIDPPRAVMQESISSLYTIKATSR